MKKNRITDDGCSPELVEGAIFTGYYDYPLVNPPYSMEIPKYIIPFRERKYHHDYKDVAIGISLDDSDVIRNPNNYIDEFRKYNAIMLTDSSVCKAISLSAVIANVYRNHEILSFFHRQGLNVIPHVRWSNEKSYKTIANYNLVFDGYPKDSIISISIPQEFENNDLYKYFKEGLKVMLDNLRPTTVIVYGKKSNSILQDFTNKTKFVYIKKLQTNI